MFPVPKVSAIVSQYCCLPLIIITIIIITIIIITIIIITITIIITIIITPHTQPLPPYPYMMAFNFGSVVLVDVWDEEMRARALQAAADCTDAPQRVSDAMVREFEDGAYCA